VILSVLAEEMEMRPKKNPNELRDVLLNVRLTSDEADVFRAQATYHRKGLSEYLRDLARQDGNELHSNDKIRKDDEGVWEVLVMGEWRKIKK
jgi:hypothetical protein